jgi:hypothetical protein
MAGRHLAAEVSSGRGKINGKPMVKPMAFPVKYGGVLQMIP